MTFISRLIFISFFTLVSGLYPLIADKVQNLEPGLLSLDASPEPISPENHLKTNIESAKTPVSNAANMNIVIVSASSPSLAHYWEKRIEKTRKYLFSPKTIVICVDEDWAPGGAGNGLGTLYTYRKAFLKAKNELGVNILQEQSRGASIAMYHTAGQGKRLAPLTISEFGIKSAVKLPGLLYPPSNENGQAMPITLLEATIKQSMLFSESGKGRLSVFWSDQVFIPSTSCLFSPDHHISIFVKRIPFPNRDKWDEQSLNNYGLLAWDEDRRAKLFDKCTYETFGEILSSHKAISDQGIGISMGAFTLSTKMLLALLKEFEKELNDKTALLDSDPYFWMPLTLDSDSYTAAMIAKGVDSEAIQNHYERMQKFKKAFYESIGSSDSELFGAIDIGAESYWWDYGTLDSYFKNNMKMTEDTLEADLMRNFYHLSHLKDYGRGKNRFKFDDSSVGTGNRIRNGESKNSLLINVSAKSIAVENCIAIGCELHTMHATGALTYHIKERKPIILRPDSVRADVTLPRTGRNFKLRSSLTRDGKADWSKRHSYNAHSWQEFTESIFKEELEQNAEKVIRE